MTNILFTADLHIGHEVINKYCYRPYPASSEMDAYMLERWNASVGVNDLVYIVGDIHHGRGSVDAAIQWLSQANGRKILVHGNHDNVDALRPYLYANYPIRVLRRNETAFPVDIVLFHYPIESWEGRNKGALHLHGHSHGKAAKVSRRYDVGVDVWNYKPVHIDEIREKLQNDPWKAEWT